MSEETQTPLQETNPPIQQEDNFDVINEMQARDEWQKISAERAQNIIEAQPLEPLTPPSPLRNKGIVFGAGIVLGALLATGVSAEVADRIIPGEEIASASGNVLVSEGIQPSVDRAIDELELDKKIDAANTTPRQDVYSQAVHVYSDKNGVVFPGQPVEVIATKSAIFGNITYEAVESHHPIEVK
ncbi:hypothetical protein H7200_01590 [Candidatus Saccharibacteria bacterium]|nr:hypothetical protein [Candidatus Saccharibacteria bacterium]